MWFWVGPANVPPASDSSPPPTGLFSTRPPTRLRASSTNTERSSAHELARGGQAGEAGADHHHVGAARASRRLRRRRLAASASRHARRQRTGARDRPRFEQLAPADRPSGRPQQRAKSTIAGR